MSIRVFTGLWLAAALLASPAHADCEYPRAPVGTPDGATATKEEMMAGMAALKEYNAKVSTYLECLDQESAQRVAAAGGDEARIAQIKEMHQKRQEAAELELQAHADRFNEQVRIYKAKQKDK